MRKSAIRPGIVKQVAEQVRRTSPNAIVIVVSSPLAELGTVAAQLTGTETERTRCDTEARVNGNAWREHRVELTASLRQLIAIGDELALSRHEAMHVETPLRYVESGLRSVEL